MCAKILHSDTPCETNRRRLKDWRIRSELLNFVWKKKKERGAHRRSWKRSQSGGGIGSGASSQGSSMRLPRTCSSPRPPTSCFSPSFQTSQIFLHANPASISSSLHDVIHLQSSLVTKRVHCEAWTPPRPASHSQGSSTQNPIHPENTFRVWVMVQIVVVGASNSRQQGMTTESHHRRFIHRPVRHKWCHLATYPSINRTPHHRRRRFNPLEHLHPWAERQALQMRFEGLQACTEFF